MAFGTILSMGSRSYSAVLLKNNSVVGISQSCKTPQRAIDVALGEAVVHKEQNPEFYEDGTIADVLVCDSAIYLSKAIEELARQGLKAIIQPGGLSQDNELIEFCNTHLISMIFTGMTHLSC
jgi:phosphoribosylaminoimidazolecarboxamide formyltransferase/IMP cyclohydrolase